MRVLGIDTASTSASAALLANGQVVADEIRRDVANPHSGRVPAPHHAEIILPLIEAVLRKGGTSIEEISGIALSIGPGSFTGLRVGLSTVKGLAYGCALPVVGVSTLLANAARVTDWEGLICSFFDARRNEVYAALIRKQASSLDRLTEDLVGDPERIADTVRSFTGGAPVLFVGDGTKLYGDLLSRWFGAFSSNSGESYPSVASAVARLSEDRFQRKDVDFLGSLAPVYLRRSETKLKATSVV